MLLLILATIAAPDFARGMAAVDTRPTDAVALRAIPSPSPSYRLGAAYRAWRNASAAIEHDSTHPTGDGGDEEVLAEDCSDERIAFTALETERQAAGATPAQVAGLAGDGAVATEAWAQRQSRSPIHCRH